MDPIAPLKRVSVFPSWPASPSQEAHVEKIRALFSQLGADKTGIITYAMFEEGLRSPPVIEYFETLGIRSLLGSHDQRPPTILKRTFLLGLPWEGNARDLPFAQGLDVWDAWSFFKLLDLDAGGSVEIEEPLGVEKK